MIFSYSKLKGRIIEKFGTRKKFAEEIGITETALSRKLNCKTGFSQDDIEQWANILDISISEYGDYFFA